MTLERNLQIKLQNGSAIDVYFNENANETIESLENLIYEETGVRPEHQRLVLGSMSLPKDTPLMELYKVGSPTLIPVRGLYEIEDVPGKAMFYRIKDRSSEETNYLMDKTFDKLLDDTLDNLDNLSQLVSSMQRKYLQLYRKKEIVGDKDYKAANNILNWIGQNTNDIDQMIVKYYS